MANYQTEIQALEAVLNAGASSVQVDGMATRYDLAEVRKRLAELKALDDAAIDAGRVRPVVARIYLGNF